MIDVLINQVFLLQMVLLECGLIVWSNKSHIYRRKGRADVILQGLNTAVIIIPGHSVVLNLTNLDKTGQRTFWSLCELNFAQLGPSKAWRRLNTHI